MIQPSFMFMVGTSMAFSYAGRAARGDSYGQLFRHAVVRAFVLVLLGIFLRSRSTSETNFTFEDVLTQIGLGYVFLFLLWGRSFRVQLLAAVVILAAYWLLVFLLATFAGQIMTGKPWACRLTGRIWWATQSHWDKNANPGHYFDQWYLNLFPRSIWVFNGGGYLTLSFIPSLATMLFGLMAGELLRSNRSPCAKPGWLLGAGVIPRDGCWFACRRSMSDRQCRIWTPSWALYSGGLVCGALAAFYAIVDVAGWLAGRFLWSSSA